MAAGNRLFKPPEPGGLPRGFSLIMPLDSSPLLDFPATAEAAGLRHSGDDEPGITRRRSGTGFSYRRPDGTAIRDADVIKRIRKLAIPPAYTDVWICSDPDGHLQATGIDARGRKQYRYHPQWREVRDADKFGRMLAFGKALTKIRAQVDIDLGERGLTKRRVLATLVRLLETTLVRVGNDRYVRMNKSFGLTTLRKRHVAVEGTHLTFEFRAKSGKMHACGLRDRRLSAIIRRCQELRGQQLFQWVDAEGVRHPIDSSDVNAYLRDITGQDFTAKDFRTWAGTLLAARTLATTEPAASATAAKQTVVRCIASVAARLNNTPAVCRKCYIHPEVLGAYLSGDLAVRLGRIRPGEDGEVELATIEKAVLRFLRGSAAEAAARTSAS